MPLYEYTCDKCHAGFELLIRGSETAQCPECGSESLTKELSVPSAHIAGGSLPISSRGGHSHAGGGCGRPQCGMGGCQGLG